MIEQTPDFSEVVNLILYFVAALILVMCVLGVYYWIKQMGKRKPMDDIDWSKEEEKLLLLADEKKGIRKKSESLDVKDGNCAPKKG